MTRAILLTCEDFYPHVGGAEVCVANLRRIFRAQGYRVSVFTNTVGTTDDEEGVVRLRWKFAPAALLAHVRVLWRLIGQTDIVHCQYSFRIAAICAVIAWLRGKPLLLTQQGRGIVPEAHPTRFGSLFFRLCQNVSIKGATRLTSTSDEITDLTAAFVPREKITLVSNGYDAELFAPDPSLPVPSEYAAPPSDAKRLLTIRRLVPKNGIHILIQALALVAKERTDFHYFAVGEGRMEPFIRTLIEKYALQNQVTLLGKRGNDTLRAYYQHADLLLVPSSAEARSIACIEAMGMRKPLIASRVGGLIDLLGRESTYGQLVSIYDSEACTYDPPDFLPEQRLRPLADAILAFLCDPSPLAAKAVLAREHVKDAYSWEAIARQYVSLYDQLLSPRRHGAR